MEQEKINYYLFNDEIDTKNVNNLIDKLNTLEGKVRLYFSTYGGHTFVMEYLLDYLNSRKDEITIILTSKVHSAGTDILLDFKGKIEISQIDTILFHLADRETLNFRKDDYASSAKKLKKQDKKYNKDYIEKCRNKNLLTEKQLNNLAKGKNVVVYEKQIKKWKLN